MLKIYGRANSINVRKVLWAADELGLTYDREDWGRGFTPVTEAAFMAINPLGQIPAIDDDGFLLSESHAIIRYLTIKAGNTELYPDDLKRRAEIDRWMDWQAVELTGASRAAFLGGVVKAAIPGGDEVIKASYKEWAEKIALLEFQLARTSGHVAGAQFTLADIPVGLSVNRWFVSPLPDMERPNFPAVTAYYERLSQRPAFMAHGRNGLP